MKATMKLMGAALKPGTWSHVQSPALISKTAFWNFVFSYFKAGS